MNSNDPKNSNFAATSNFDRRYSPRQNIRQNSCLNSKLMPSDNKGKMSIEKYGRTQNSFDK